MNAGRILFLAIGVWALSGMGAHAQKNKNQLQREKQRNQERIKETEKILAEASQKKKNTLGELTALNQRINQQETLILSIKSEIELLDRDLSEDQAIIEALEKDLKNLKDEYARMVYAAQKASGKANKLLLLFSASSFDQLLMRLKYMEQYGRARQVQAEAITRVQEILSEQVALTEAKRQDQQKLLDEEEKENQNLTALKDKQRGVVRSLEREEKQLRRDLEDTKKAIAQLDKLISDIIKEEIARAEREAREREAARSRNKNSSPAVSTTASTLASSSFEGNKNQFAWPASGFVSQKFGRQKHPVLKGIEIASEGVIIQTKRGEAVHAIFEGDVREIAILPPPFFTTVILRHGEYFTVYSGLKDVVVKKGQKVTTYQPLGLVQTNGEGISELRFQVRKNGQPLDPQAWLKN
ncbi:MAG: peptidoglycan DD-metalloendopeptidase family protein [Cyclobacteriaceae bacterium]|nr:peptidoglycan DD-metalloendopeptidase family protein [Cyclobacteriaceae bacterium]